MIVLQPDGRFAMFSTVVDDFTYVDMDTSEALQACIDEGMKVTDAIEAVRRGLEAGADRYRECLETIDRVHNEEWWHDD